LLLYDIPFSGNCYKVRLLLAHLGFAYERQSVTDLDRSERTGPLRELSPVTRVPTIVLDDGRSLSESGAILCCFGEGTRFVPSDPYMRAQMLQWMFFEQYDHEPPIARVRFWLAYSGTPELFPGDVDESRAAGYEAFAAMERHLSNRDWFVASTMTLADIALYAYSHVAHEGGFDLAPYPSVRAWLERVAAQPGHVTIDA
jgi:glutathione S-transferase